MKTWYSWIAITLLIIFCPCIGIAQETSATTSTIQSEQTEPSTSALTLDELLKRVETRYSGVGFSALFFQKSTLKAMQMTDTANGKLWIKPPGKMRWEYEAPEKQIIITDGDDLWVHRPEDNQVMLGKAGPYFGDGKGASFLSDISLIRDKFTVTIENSDEPQLAALKLFPKEKKLDIAVILLFIDKKTFDVVKIKSLNSYGDETVIELTDFTFDQNPADSFFSFDIPETADILQLEE